MKSTIKKGFFILFTFLFCGVALSQDSIPEYEGSSDSLKYVVPAASKAELSYIVAPDGFTVSKDFNGYIHKAASTAIMMTLIDDVTYTIMDGTMTDEYFSENNFKFISKSKIVSESGINGVQYKLSFTSGDRDFIRYMVWAGDLNKTLWLNITYPKTEEVLVELEILKAINSINLNTPGQ